MEKGRGLEKPLRLGRPGFQLGTLSRSYEITSELRELFGIGPYAACAHGDGGNLLLKT